MQFSTVHLISYGLIIFIQISANMDHLKMSKIMQCQSCTFFMFLGCKIFFKKNVRDTFFVCGCTKFIQNCTIHYEVLVL